METDGWKHLSFSHLIENQKLMFYLQQYNLEIRVVGGFFVGFFLLVFLKSLKKEFICLFPQLSSHLSSLFPLHSSQAVQQHEKIRQMKGVNSDERKMPSLYHENNLRNEEVTPESLK